MNGSAAILLLLLALLVILALTSARGKDAFDVAMGRAKAVR